jgi:low affinity Fe/Cu permease
MGTRWASFSASFGRGATRAAEIVGSPWAFAFAVVLVVTWGLLGSYFQYSDTWQLVINTGTTIITFLMVFLIQNTQNRDARALHLKLDELIRSVHSAHNDMINIEKLSDDELKKLADKYEAISKEYESRNKSKAA